MRRALAAALAAFVLAGSFGARAEKKRAPRSQPAASPPAAAPKAPAPAPIQADPRHFPRPASIDGRVRFWVRVFGEVETNEGFVHDARRPEIVYDVVRWPKNQSESMASQRYQRAQAQVREILKRLATRGPVTAEEKRILALFPKGVSASALREAAEGVRFQRGQADKFRAGYMRSGRWEDHIARAFRERGLPGELSALPHVESSFNPFAYSHAGAAGLWQFMPTTARMHGLRVDRHLDERFDPYRASDGAADLLQSNYRMLGTWPLALTAYNHGPGGMMRAVRAVGTRDIGAIIDRYEGPNFGFASRNFYPEFLAVVEVERTAPQLFGPLRRDPPVEPESVRTDGAYAVNAVAGAFGVDIGLLRELNPALREPVWKGQAAIPRGTTLRVPRVAGRAPAAQVLASLPKAQTREVHGRTHVVKRGETLSRIARRYGVSERALASANGIKARNVLVVGRRLRIPGSVEVAVASDAAARKPPARARTQPAARPAAAKTYTVRRGDTLSSIARRHGVSLNQLIAANGLSRTDPIRTGQKLRVPGSDG
jgi:membrane-bound lytic murein transglycosylase D